MAKRFSLVSPWVFLDGSRPSKILQRGYLVEKMFCFGGKSKCCLLDFLDKPHVFVRFF